MDVLRLEAGRLARRQPLAAIRLAGELREGEAAPGRAAHAVLAVRYLVAHDCGHVINPVIVDGQIHGGVAQGVGAALFEEMVYDEAGQLLSSGFMDYHVPLADELPFIETVHLEFPSPLNPLGLKGVGEGGTVAAGGAIANAVEDALAPLGVRVTSLPLTPARVRALIEGAQHGGAETP